jgi:hypothetical protein
VNTGRRSRAQGQRLEEAPAAFPGTADIRYSFENGAVQRRSLK